MTALLEVEDLTVQLPGPEGYTTVVDGIDFSVDVGSVLGMAGESGSGKSMTGLALLQLLPPRARLTGRIVYQGRELVGAPRRAMQELRGTELAMVFQDPMSSLHPMLSIGKTLTGPLRRHFSISAKEAWARAAEALETVRIPDPESAMRAYPHQFSGGMRQRIAIALALSCRPSLLIADEPTTALDVTVQAGVMSLLNQVQQETGMGVILITHDLGVMSSLADDLVVMYAGRVAESGPKREVLQAPLHPYTSGLLGSLPQPDGERQVPLVPIPGSPPTADTVPGGCALHPRCPRAEAECSVSRPELIDLGYRRVACPVVVRDEVTEATR